MLRKSICIIFLLYACALCGSKTLIWSDEFDYTGLPDSTKWDYDIGGNGWGNRELQYYAGKRTENSRVENGNLIIETRKETFKGKEYTSARLKTEDLGDWLYGRIEVRAKLPPGRGLWPAIWMLPTDWEYGNWPSSGEIDIMENVGYDPQKIFFTIHTELYNHTKSTQKSTSIILDDPHATFHVYAVERFDDHIDFYCDDTLRYTFNNENTGPKTWPFDQRFHLLLNIAVGGSWGGTQGIDTTIFPQKMIVDYVRVYSLDGGKGPFKLAIDKIGNGSVTLQPAQESYDSGTVVKIIAQPEQGSEFFGFTGQLTTHADTTNLVMNRNIKAIAVFKPVGELILNGDFSSGATLWLPVGNYGGSGEGSVVNGEYQIKVTNPGTDNYNIQFNQEKLRIVKGAWYILSFDAYTQSPREIGTAINMSVSPWKTHFKDTCSLTTQKTKFTYTFQMQNETDTNARVEFDCGGNSSTVYLDNVSLKQSDSIKIRDPHISSIENHQIKVIYNRTVNTIRIEGIENAQKVQLVNLTGRIIFSFNYCKAKGSELIYHPGNAQLLPGLYCVKITSDNGVFHQMVPVFR
jgi:beta-glucanase (GH16 family)